MQDDGGSLAGSDLDATPNTITFNVAPLNDAPLGVSNTVSATEDLPYTFSAVEFGFSDPNDTPPNNFAGVFLTTVPPLGQLKNGATVLNAGDFVPAAVFGSFTYTPLPLNANGSPYTSFTFQVRDDGSGVAPHVNQDTTPRTMTINVLPANDAPTDLILTVTAPNTEDGANNVFISSGTLANGAAIGTLSATDIDGPPTDTFTFNVQGGADAAKFTVSGTTLQTAAALDGNTQATYAITLRVTDSGTPAMFRDEAFVINLNRAPTDIQVSANNVNESTTGIPVATPTTIGTLTATDADPGETFTFTIAASGGVGPGFCGIGGDVDNGSFDISGTTLRATSTFNYEATAAHTAKVCVQVADHANSTYQESMVINIADVNEPPVVNAAGPFSIAENSANNSTVGTQITYTDPESGVNGAANQTYTYSIQSGNTGNAFSIDATGQIKVATSSALNFETTPTFTLVVRVTDAGGAAPNGLFGETTVTVNVTDVNEAPVAVAASHNVAGNINISVAAGNLFTGATDPDAADNTGGFAAHHTAQAVNNLSGRLVVNTNGSYTYNPPVGVFTGSEIGTFKICDDGADNTPPGAQQCSADTNITFNFSEGIWFVNNNGGACSSSCDGRLTNPFTSVAALNTAQGTANGPAASESIFIYQSATEYSGPLTLLAGQKLFGQDASSGTTLAAITGVTPPADSAPLPTLMSADGTFAKINSAGTTLTLNSATGNNTLRGFTLTNATTMALSGSGFGALTISEVSIANAGAGGALSLSTGTLAAGATIDSLAATPTGTNIGVLLNNITSGSLAVNGSGALAAANTGGTHGFSVVSGSVGVTYAGSISQSGASAGGAVSVSGGHNATLTFNGNVGATNGTGLQFDNADGTYVFNGATNALNGGDAGIDILNGSSGTFSFSSGTSITNPSGTAFNASSSSANVTYNGTISKNSAGGGINLATNTGTVSFTGALTLTTSTGVAFNATGGGTVTSTNTTSTLSTTTATALNVSGTTIGANGLKFTSINSDGGATGIVLASTTGACTTNCLVVSGTGVTPGSGGTIQNKTGRGASFITANGISLSNMNFTNTATTDLDADNSGLSTGDNLVTNAAVHLQTVFNASLDRVAISGSAEAGINGHFVTNFSLTNSSVLNAGNGPDEDGIHFYNMLGTSVITNTTLTSSGDDNMNIQNNTPGAQCAPAVCPAFPAGMTSVLTLTISGGSANTGVLGSGYLMGIRGTSTATVVVSGVTSNNNFSGGVVIDTFDTATSDVTVTGSTITNNNDAVSLSSHNGNTRFNISNNVSFAGTDFARVSILKSAFATTGTLQGQIANNPIVVSDGQSADGVIVFAAGGGNTIVNILNNTFTYRGSQRAINIQGGQDGAANLQTTITGNSIEMQIDGTNNPVTAIMAQVAVASPSGDNSSLCADIGGAGALRNTITHTNGAGGAPAANMVAGDIRTRQRFATVVRLPGYGGTASDTAAVVAYLTGRNLFPVPQNTPIATATDGITAGDPGAQGYLNTVGGLPCMQPSLP